jgi:hypothetical protein
MPRVWLVCISIIALVGCKSKSASLSGDEPVDAKVFLDAFPLLTQSFTAADTNVQKKADTTVISRAVFTQFIPDSALQKFLGKDSAALQIKPVGRIENENEKYLLATFTQKRATILIAFVLDKKKKYQASLQLLSNRNDDDYRHSVVINREPTFTLSREKSSDNNTVLQYTRNGYAYNNSSATFIKVVDDSNEGKKKNDAIINPIDTLSRKSKFSGDYVVDKKNFISVRDGKNATTYDFFMHFEKDDGNCVGELKGEMSMHGDGKALYQESGDPCEIDFVFEDNEVKVKERGNCGNHRGIKCYFDDTYAKKKEKKPKKSSK